MYFFHAACRHWDKQRCFQQSAIVPSTCCTSVSQILVVVLVVGPVQRWSNNWRCFYWGLNESAQFSGKKKKTTANFYKTLLSQKHLFLSVFGVENNKNLQNMFLSVYSQDDCVSWIEGWASPVFVCQWEELETGLGFSLDVLRFLTEGCLCGEAPADPRYPEWRRKWVQWWMEGKHFIKQFQIIHIITSIFLL